MGSVSIGALIFLVWMCALSGCCKCKFFEQWEEFIKSELEEMEDYLDDNEVIYNHDINKKNAVIVKLYEY